MLTCFVVTVSCVLYFLLFVYFHIFSPESLFFCFFVACIFGVVESKTVTKDGNIRSGPLPGFWNRDSQSNEKDSPLVS